MAGWIDTSQAENRAGYWLVKTDENGFVEINKFFQPGDWDGAQCFSLIQCDDGGYLLGGYVEDTTSASIIKILRTDPEGNQIWMITGPDLSECYAVIELKAGDYIACGRILDQAERAYVMRFDDDANIVWERSYQANIGARFSSVREVDGGFLFGGSGVTDEVTARIVKTNERGDVIWFNSYEFPEIYSLISCRIGGFAATGGHSRRGVEGGTAKLLKIDAAGNQQWLDGYYANSYAMGLTELNDGFVIVGTYGNAELTRTNLNGDSIFYRRFQPNEQIAGSLISTISDPDGAVYMAGKSLRNGVRGGVIVRLTPSRLAPLIISQYPPIQEFEALIGESVFFSIEAIDAQDDSLSYLWMLNNQELYPDTVDSIASIVIFEEAGFDTIVCMVWDADGSDTATWHVTVTDLYVSAFTPDTLDFAIRRGSSVDFSLDTIRYTDGAEPEILWTKTNLSNGQTEETGRDAGATIDFPWSGEYSVEGRVSRGESSDAVTWHVLVKGAIWAYVPVEDSLEVLPDSIIHFEVVPSAPEDESLEVNWLVDGELVREGEMSLDWAFSTVDNCRRYLVQCVVADSVEADTVGWVVTVNDLNVGSEIEVGNPGRVALLSVSPNPFNSTLTIRFTGGLETAATRLGYATGSQAAPTRLGIYDIAGREVARLLGSTGVSAGQGFHPAAEGGATEHQITWDASASSAGVYFVRLQAGNAISTKKVVLMR